jgi:predicted Fe-S protein YdhL (DUF1289 family)
MAVKVSYAVECDRCGKECSTNSDVTRDQIPPPQTDIFSISLKGAGSVCFKDLCRDCLQVLANIFNERVVTKSRRAAILKSAKTAVTKSAKVEPTAKEVVRSKLQKALEQRFEVGQPSPWGPPTEPQEPFFVEKEVYPWGNTDRK